jgi:probable DNA metabolism protein
LDEIMNDLIYYYDGSFQGFLCCIFDSYLYKEVPTAILRDEDAQPTLYDSRTIQTDPGHAERVFRKVTACSSYAANLLHKGFLTCLTEKEMHLYRLVRKLLAEGSGFLGNVSDPALYPVYKAVQHLNSEAHLLKGFVRFSDLGGVLVSEIQPKNQVLPLLRSHFCARCQSERFFIYDRTHREALFYADGRAVIRPLSDFQMAPPDATEAGYRQLWKRFYDTIAIRERENPRGRMTSMPKRYWGTMTEFQDEDYFIPRSSPAAGPVPGAPAGRSVPGKPPAPGLSAPGSAL